MTIKFKILNAFFLQHKRFKFVTFFLKKKSKEYNVLNN